MWVIRIGLALAMIGQLKTCTLVMAGLAAEKTERGVMSYGKFSRALTDDSKIKKARSADQWNATSPSQ